MHNIMTRVAMLIKFFTPPNEDVVNVLSPSRFLANMFLEGQGCAFATSSRAKQKLRKARNFPRAIKMARNATKMALTLEWHVLTL